MEKTVDRTERIMGGRDHSVSFVRLTALLMIILCHVLQYYQCELSRWFNVGVQIFLCISGFLYGQREIKSIKSFYLRRIIKIGLPFLILTVVEIAVYFAFAREHISPVSAVRILFLDKTLYGGEHLWFIPTILFCYALTPLMDRAFRNADRKRFLLTAGLGALLILWTCSIFTVFNPAWITCYFIGFAVGVNEKHVFFKKKTVVIFFGCLALMNALQIYLDYATGFKSAGKIEQFYKTWKDYNHVWLGVFLFCILKQLFSLREPGTFMRRVLSVADKYSYECFLVHQFVILGPFTLLQVTKYGALNIAICLACICVLTFLLKTADTIAERCLIKSGR